MRIVSLFILSLLTGCGHHLSHTIFQEKEEETYKLQSDSIYEISNRGIIETEKDYNDSIITKLDRTTIQLPIETTDRAVLTIYNNTGKNLATGAAYMIEYFNGEKWVEPLRKPGYNELKTWHANRINIPPHKGHEFWVYFFSGDYDYIPGLYRFVKKYSLGKETEKRSLYVEFKVVK